MLTEIINKKLKIHSRDLTLATYPHTHGKIIVHGILKDQRYIPVFDVTGEIKNPGTIHHMDVKMLKLQLLITTVKTLKSKHGIVKVYSPVTMAYLYYLQMYK